MTFYQRQLLPSGVILTSDETLLKLLVKVRKARLAQMAVSYDTHYIEKNIRQKGTYNSPKANLQVATLRIFVYRKSVVSS